MTEAADEARCYDDAVAEFGSSLARLAAAYEFDRAQPQDLLQEIHLALWRSFAGFRNQCSLRTWVYRVAGASSRVIGLGAGARQPNWTISVLMTGVFLSMYIALVIHGKMLAQRWQREIESLRSLRDEPR